MLNTNKNSSDGSPVRMRGTNTGLVDSGENVFSKMLSTPFDYSTGISAITNMMDSMGFKIAVSGKTVYVGKRDGHLAQSF